jgi:3-oxoacyl-[acyl-carrier protein] reductase
MRKILIAGCSSGIGEYLYQSFGATEGKYETKGLSRTSGDYICDCTNPKEVFAAINDYKPDILINCIGQARMNPAILSSVSCYEEVVTNNIRGTFILCREAGRYMLSNNFGRIINFGSCTCSMFIEGESLYTASKAGVVAFSNVLARELAPHVTVNCISPGPIDTALIAGVKPEKIKAVVDRQIIKRKATFQDVEHVVKWLMREDTGMITGQNIYLNGAGQ